MFNLEPIPLSEKAQPAFLKNVLAESTRSGDRTFTPDESMVCDIDGQWLTLYRHASNFRCTVLARIERDHIRSHWQFPVVLYIFPPLLIVAVWCISITIAAHDGSFKPLLIGVGFTGLMALVAWLWHSLARTQAKSIHEFLASQARAAESAALQ